jgi:acetyltransferase-like isoleucine patch superfamily enzyme
VTPYTYSSDAVIAIGDRVFLNGTRFGCREKITIGSRSILAECRILDNDFHSVHPDHRNDPAYIRSIPITIGENVWVTAQCVVLKGATIGRDSTITVNSVVRDSIPERSVAGGNPAVVWKTLTV